MTRKFKIVECEDGNFTEDDILGISIMLACQCREAEGENLYRIFHERWEKLQPIVNSFINGS